MCLHMPLEVGAIVCACKNANRPGGFTWHMPCPLHAFPAQFQENPVLRIHQFRLARTDSKERCVKLLDVFDDATCRDVTGFGTFDCTHAGIKIIRTEEGDGILAFAQVFPERLHILRARETPSHGDDGNGVVFRSHARIGAQQAGHAHVVQVIGRLRQCRGQCSRCRILENAGDCQCTCSNGQSGFTFVPG